MKYLTLLLFLSGCATAPKTYTNEECIKTVCNIAGCDSYDRADRALVTIGVSIECANNGNDPEKTVDSLRKSK